MKNIEFFSQENCGPCKMFKPILAELIKDKKIEANNITLEDNGRDAFLEKKVRSTPTIIFYKDGEEVDRFSGFMPKENFLEKYNNL